MELEQIESALTERTLEDKVDRLLDILEPLAGFVERDLPVIAAQAGPIIAGLKESPVLKLLGVRL